MANFKVGNDVNSINSHLKRLDSKCFWFLLLVIKLVIIDTVLMHKKCWDLLTCHFLRFLFLSMWLSSVILLRYQTHKLLLGQIQLNLTQCILGWRKFKFVQMKGPALFKGGGGVVNNSENTLHWRNLKILFSRTIRPISPTLAQSILECRDFKFKI